MIRMFNKIPIRIIKNDYILPEEESVLRKKWRLRWVYVQDKNNNEIPGLNGEVYEYKISKLREYCRKHHLKFEINNNFGKRSTDYRKEFFSHYHPFLGNSIYLCAYCGRPVTKRKMQIDHIYPVAKVNKSIKLQNKLKRMGATSVNSYQNLAPSCAGCNYIKKANMGHWIYLGFIGRNSIIRFTMDYAIIFIFYKIILYFL